METRSKRKSASFKFQKTKNSRLNIDFIQNQSTLLGSYLNLMEKQKVIVAIIRLKNSKNESKLVPICFKVEENQLPGNLELLQIHPNNVIEILIPGCKPFSAMIVSTGGDSKELFESYSVFVSNSKEKRITNLENKINNWLNVEGIKITKSSCKGLLATAEEEFEMLMSKVKTIKNRSRSSVPASSQKNVAVIDLSDQKSDHQIESNLHSSLKKLKELNRNLLSPAQIQKAFAEIINILESCVNSTKQYQDSGEFTPTQYDQTSAFSEIRMIPEKNKTYEDGNTTMIEGVLPILTKKYKKSLTMGNAKDSEFKPSSIMTNIIRYAFPKHWLIGVTLRGSGGKKSLLSVWNYRNPLVDPCVGPFENGLGESRLRALIDHVMRKSKKNSYDKATEKFLITVLSKALNYARTKVTPSKAKSPSHSILESEESEDYEDLENNEDDESDSDSNDYIPITHINLSQIKKEKFSEDENSRGFNKKTSNASTSKDATLDLSDFCDPHDDFDSTAFTSSQKKDCQSGFSQKNMLVEDSLSSDKEVAEENSILFYDEKLDEKSRESLTNEYSNEPFESESFTMNNETVEGDFSRFSALANSTKDSGIDEATGIFKTSTPKRSTDIPSSQVIKKTRIERILEEKDQSGSCENSTTATASTSKKLTDAEIDNLIGNLPDKELAQKVAASLRNKT